MNAGHPAYFIGVDLPSGLSERIFSFKWRLHRDISHSLKPLIPHITLLHPSSLRDSPPEVLLPNIKSAAAPYLPITIRLEDIGAFDHAVLYIRVHSPELVALQSELVKLLPAKSQNIYRNRGYLPHITLAQVPSPQVLEIENLQIRTKEELDLPDHITVGSLFAFTQTHPREYKPQII